VWSNENFGNFEDHAFKRREDGKDVEIHEWLLSNLLRLGICVRIQQMNFSAGLVKTVLVSMMGKSQIISYCQISYHSVNRFK